MSGPSQFLIVHTSPDSHPRPAAMLRPLSSRVCGVGRGGGPDDQRSLPCPAGRPDSWAGSHALAGLLEETPKPVPRKRLEAGAGRVSMSRASRRHRALFLRSSLAVVCLGHSCGHCRSQDRSAGWLSSPVPSPAPSP